MDIDVEIIGNEKINIAVVGNRYVISKDNATKLANALSVFCNNKPIIDKACETFKATCKEQGAGSCDREWLCDGCRKYETFRKAMKGGE